MSNVYDVLPENFFNIFNGSDRRVVADCIVLLHGNMKSDFTYSLSKESATEHLTDYFNSKLVDVDTEDEEDNLTSKSKANKIITKLKLYGWMEEEITSSYSMNLIFLDYTIDFISALLNLNKRNDLEYSGYVFTIHNLLYSFDINNGSKVIEQVYKNTEILFKELKLLNSNMKNYLQKLINDKNNNNLKGLLETLLNEYQLKIVDRAYYNLTNKDHPDKYKLEILRNLKAISDNDNIIERITRQIMDQKDITYIEATERLDQQLDYISSQFDSISEVITEINEKNDKYVSSAINRIKFILDINNDIEGKINKIIKNIDIIEDNDIVVSTLNRTMVFAPSTLSKPKIEKDIEDSFIELKEDIDESSIKRMQDRIRISTKYSQDEINKYVLSYMNNNTNIDIEQIPIKDSDDFTRIILIYIYGYSTNMSYTIIDKEEYININGYNFRSFILKKKLKQSNKENN